VLRQCWCQSSQRHVQMAKCFWHALTVQKVVLNGTMTDAARFSQVPERPKISKDFNLLICRTKHACALLAVYPEPNQPIAYGIQLALATYSHHSL
jgi:hypothetical protein